MLINSIANCSGFRDIDRLPPTARIAGAGVRAGARGAWRVSRGVGGLHAGHQRVRLRRQTVPPTAAGSRVAGTHRRVVVLSNRVGAYGTERGGMFLI